MDICYSFTYFGKILFVILVGVFLILVIESYFKSGNN